MIASGMRVVRGAHWSWGDQDTGEGHIGTIEKIDLNGDAVIVKWDKDSGPKSVGLQLVIDASTGNMGMKLVEKGTTYTYRSGKLAHFDLRILDFGKSVGEKQTPFKCGFCNADGIKGYRFQCNHCPSFDLCTTCYMAGNHSVQHTFTRFDGSHHEGAIVSPRCFTPKIEAFDLKVSDWNGIRAEGKTAYYRDHLALVGCPQPIPKSVSGPFLLGEKVIVTLDKSRFKSAQQGHGAWADTMTKFIDKIGTVLWTDADGDTEVLYDGCEDSWTINSSILTRVGPFCVNDVIMVTTNEVVLRKYLEQHATWDTEILKTKGMTGTIQSISPSGNLIVSLAAGTYEYSPMCCNRQGAPINMSVTRTGQQVFAMMRKGHWVTRGLDWKWGNQGGHAPGVILKVRRDEGVVHVKWDNDSTVNMYRMGAENKYDLKLVDPDQCVDNDDGDGDGSAVAGAIGELINTFLVAKLMSDLSDLASAAEEEEAPKQPTIASLSGLHRERSMVKDNIRVCSICMDRQLEVRFDPCGHEACGKCADVIDECHLCRKNIQKKVKRSSTS